MVNNFLKIVFFIFIFFPISSYSQKLFIPIDDAYLISIYKKGVKDQDGSYISEDSLGNIRIKGNFDGVKPVGKWYLFFENGSLLSNYNYNIDGNIDGLFVEYYINGQVKTVGYFSNNKQIKIWRSYYLDGIIEREGELLDGKRYKQWNYYYSSGKIKQASNYNYKGELHGFFYYL